MAKRVLPFGMRRPISKVADRRPTLESVVVEMP